MDNVTGTGIKQIDTAQAISSLRAAAPLIRQWLIDNDQLAYELTDIESVLVEWMETSIEEIATDTLYHCLSGDSAYAIGRRNFKLFLDKKPYQEIVNQNIETTETEAA
ncbi:MAG: hypothetical protein F6K11_23275 [Leptolyngbya sp. SIO3F4]|nr:hypothetical protein [Leptolyngbya sp. SIO3F4]